MAIIAVLFVQVLDLDREVDRAMPDLPDRSIFAAVKDWCVEIILQARFFGKPEQPPLERCLYVRPNARNGEIVAASDLPEPQAGTTRIVIISDTHECHNELDPLPKADILLHCGDIGMSTCCKSKFSAVRTLKDFDRFLARNTQVGKAIVIGGNHDKFLELMDDDEVKQTLPHATVLNNSSITVCNLTIYGSPRSRGKSWNAAYQPTNKNWHAGNSRSANTSQVPEAKECDILMTHGPPRGSILLGANQEKRIGHDSTLPKARLLHAFGHIHDAYGAAWSSEDSVLHICAALMGGVYVPTNGPVIVDVDMSR